MTMSNTKQVVQGHESEFPHPLVVPAGTTLETERRSTVHSGWIWCRDSAGTSAWVPESFLEIEDGIAVLTVDYDSTELTVEPGVVVGVLDEVAGWAWCRTEDGRLGWLPIENLVDRPPAPTGEE